MLERRFVAVQVRQAVAVSWKSLVLFLSNEERRGWIMGQSIDIKHFFESPALELDKALRKLDKFNEYLKWTTERLKEGLGEEKFESLSCCMCEDPFQPDQIIMEEKSPTLSKDSNMLQEISCYFHEECFKEYLEDCADDITQEDIDNYEFPKNVCQLCGTISETDLPYTDGSGYFCEECMPEMPLVLSPVKKEGE